MILQTAATAARKDVHLNTYDLCDFSIFLSSLTLAALCLRLIVKEVAAELASSRRNKRDWQVNVSDSDGCHVRTLQMSAESVGRLIKAVEGDKLA